MSAVPVQYDWIYQLYLQHQSEQESIKQRPQLQLNDQMRDGVTLLKKPITINEVVYKIIDFCHIPGNSEVYVKLRDNQGTYLNYEYKKLQPIIEKQIKL